MSASPPAAVGSFTFVLHSHLPYVLSHGQWPHGSDWLNEAAAETYVPLLDVFDRLVDEGLSPKCTVGITPVLMEMLTDEDFKTEFQAHLDRNIEAAATDAEQFARQGEGNLARVADHWRRHFGRIADSFANRHARDILGAFRRLQDAGHIEVITCSATHGYAPLLGHDTSIQAQVKMGKRVYERHMGRAPRGAWLAECAYRPRYEWAPPFECEGAPDPCVRKGSEEFFSESGIKYFIVDTHLLKGGKAAGVYIERFEALQMLWRQYEKAYRPLPESEERSPLQPHFVKSYAEEKDPVAIFVRDPRTGLLVWSGEHGYPGNPAYLDFHKKHFPGGHRYWAVTDTGADLAAKREYNLGHVEGVPAEQAAHFISVVKEQLAAHLAKTGEPGILTAPFDTELFGHWWFEGPQWLCHVLRGLAKDPEIELTTCGDYLERNAPVEFIQIPEGSWGEGGHHHIWLNEWTEWVWKSIYKAEAKMQGLAHRYGDHPDSSVQRLLRASARSLLLLQSSDWPFLISTWSARDYAELRVANHASDFERLAVLTEQCAGGGTVSDGDWNFVDETEQRDRLFEDIDPRWWAKLEVPPRAGAMAQV
jgi:1,4-alpha-glucan branching enzyme